MRIKRLVVSAMAVNCYIIVDETTNKAMVVDPGAEAQRIYDSIIKEGFEVEKILLTHCHFDHMGGVEKLRELLGLGGDIPVVIPKNDAVLAQNPVYNLSVGMGGNPFTIAFDKTLEHSDTIEIGNLKAKAIATPGHTPGGMCYYFADEGVLLSGDTLFYMSVGRTDFPLSDGRKLSESIHQMLFVLPEDTQVLPGHGECTTIGFEKANNFYI